MAVASSSVARDLPSRRRSLAVYKYLSLFREREESLHLFLDTLSRPTPRFHSILFCPRELRRPLRLSLCYVSERNQLTPSPDKQPNPFKFRGSLQFSGSNCGGRPVPMASKWRPHVPLPFMCSTVAITWLFSF